LAIIKGAESSFFYFSFFL